MNELHFRLLVTVNSTSIVQRAGDNAVVVVAWTLINSVDRYDGVSYFQGVCSGHSGTLLCVGFEAFEDAGDFVGD